MNTEETESIAILSPAKTNDIKSFLCAVQRFGKFKKDFSKRLDVK